MAKEYTVKIKVDDGRHTTGGIDSECSRDCPFLKVDHCCLFNEDLEESELLDGYGWNDIEPTMQRCWYCEKATP